MGDALVLGFGILASLAPLAEDGGGIGVEVVVLLVHETVLHGHGEHVDVLARHVERTLDLHVQHDLARSFVQTDGRYLDLDVGGYVHLHGHDVLPQVNAVAEHLVEVIVVAYGRADVAVALNHGRGGGHEAESLTVLLERARGVGVARVAVVGDGDDAVAEHLLQVLYGQDATGAVGAGRTRKLFQHHAFHGLEGEVLHVVPAHVAVVIHDHADGVPVDFTHGEGQFVGEGETDDVVLLERTLPGDGRERVVLAVEQRQGDVLVGTHVIVDGQLAADGDILLVHHHFLVGERHEVLEVAHYEDVIHEDHALVLVVVPEADVYLLAGVGGQVKGKAFPLAGESLFRFTVVERNLGNVALRLHAVDDLLCEHVEVLLTCPDDNLQLVLLACLVLLCIEGQGAELVGDEQLGSHHPVVALSGRGIYGVRAGADVGTLQRLAYGEVPGLVVLVELHGHHVLCGLEVVTLVAHHVGQGHGHVVEVLAEDHGVVRADAALITALVVECIFSAGRLGIAHHVGDGSGLHHHLVVGPQIEVLRGAWQQTDALGVGAVGQDIEFGDEVLAVLRNLVKTGLGLLADLHVGVEGDDGEDVGVVDA